MFFSIRIFSLFESGVNSLYKKGTAMNAYAWTQAGLEDVSTIVALAQQHFQTEIDQIFAPEPITMARNITFAVVNQHYLPGSESICVAKAPDGRLLAYTWAKRGERACWSDDEMIVVKMAHVDLALSARDRVRLVNGMMDIWEAYAYAVGVPVICSTTMRREQDAFLKLHSKRGYDVRGSFAYKKLDLTQATPAN
jgi:hypothetical protein